MQEHSPLKNNKPFALRLFTCLIIAVIFFCLGYSAYYISKLQQFFLVSLGQKITTASHITSPKPYQTNILLLGSDNDQKFTGNPLTQTMIIVHIDYAKNEVDMFSIPRDLWVKMPDRLSYGKIDQAAEYDGVPSAIKVVEQTFGIPIDHYAWVGLYGFIKSINALGGVNLQVVHPVLDNSYPTDINNPNPYGYQRLDIQAGMQHMSGEEALQYVRSRHEDQLGDFGRTERQRQLLLALKQLIFSSPNIVTESPQLIDNLKGQIKTDLFIGDGAVLGVFFLTHQNTLTEKQFTLSPPVYSQTGISTDGQSIVVANADNTARLITNIFGPDAGQITLKSLSSIKNIKP